MDIGLLSIPAGACSGMVGAALYGFSLRRQNFRQLGAAGFRAGVAGFMGSFVVVGTASAYEKSKGKDKLSERFELLSDLPQGDKIIACYVWTDGHGDLRCKSKTLDSEPKSPEDLPIWSYDGSKTYQAEGSSSEIYLQPVALYADPFNGSKNKLVLCETLTSDKMPTESNKRRSCRIADVMNQAKYFEPRFGIEQKYSLLDVDGRPFERKVDLRSHKDMTARWEQTSR
ncbi:glutamine synthetase-like [Paramacrobiotus metropolitanus]|uniref:glutamine synthetase-like n=1 Tax=Paramacrobiotus metropolitanus TaxID=2943436 RepID=UPI0024464F4E|nr:glutamine synthetase-like [Paramacrobiotus metropolitanus]